MTLCNMSIEAGSRVGMVAPDETTFAYLHGRPLAPQGAAWDRGGRPLADACAPIRARSSTARWRSTFPACRPMSPGAPTRRRRRRSADGCRIRKRSRIRTAATGCARSLSYMGLSPGTPFSRDRHRPGLHRLLHQRPHRGSARCRRRRRRPQRVAERRRHRRAGFGERAPRRPKPRGSTASSATPASNGAIPAARCASR